MLLSLTRSRWITTLNLLLALSLALTTGLISTPAQAQQTCEALFVKAAEQAAGRTPEAILAERGKALPERNEVLTELAKFAAENNMPARWIEVGPPERRVKRLFVAIDANNADLMQAYHNRFNLSQPIGAGTAGTLALEFFRESVITPEHYVSGVLRVSNNPNDKIYRWGREDMTWQSWWNGLIVGHKTPDHVASGVLAYGHLFELNAAEKANVDYFLKHPEERGPCKSDNCVAWTSSIELKKTKTGTPDEERGFLMSELGVARSMAHFEIQRRFIHAANERHSAIAVFVEGEKGLASFATLKETDLVPQPKIPYGQIIKGLGLSENSPAVQAIAAIPDGAKVFLPIAAGASPDAVSAMIYQAAKMQKGIDLHVLVNGIGANEFRKGIETTDGKFRVSALFLGGNLRELHKEGRVDVIPGNLSDFTRLVRDPNQTDFHYDAIVVRVSEADAYGYHSLGPNSDMIMTILRDRPGIKIIAEVNPNVPYTNGENKIHRERLTSSFKSTTQLAGPAVVPVGPVDAAIGKHIGSLVESESTLQIGIGNIFGGVPDGLSQAGRRGIKISTEMFGDHMMEMMDRGIATSAETGFAYGSSNLYRWLNRNERVTFRETEFVNSPGRIADIPKFHAVNTALQVNLHGEVNATMGPEGRISSPGGQVEFMTGASRSAGGKAIIAVRSTAKNETISSIVLDLYDGPITTPHESVSHVVTEYGIAQLKGKTERQRAKALIGIAHPKFRAELIQQALARRLITASDAAEIPRGGAL